ncbi:hypothetical protein BDZ85DRAFT_266503 [Elsinoe ampelina]|uniref:Uncharacterized protein n=1 Tax=Elsinoe ampelina TaxID=302913 RepID=A0A6A6G6P1_9PEZI|nr:hypothetical protein BDZ85DRAFT_266503 [Elsinoe ampelina]
MDADSFRQAFVGPEQSCLSNCTLLGTDEACCRGMFNDPTRCPASSPALKQACPRAYSYAYDDFAATYIWRWSSQSMLPLLTLTSCV